MELAALLTLAAWVTAASVLIGWAADRWRYRSIPGPFAPPLIGNLPSVVSRGFHVYLDECRRRYGRVFKIYMGSVPFIVVADPDLARRVNHRLVDRQLGPQLSADRGKRADDTLLGLATANGDEWRALRLAWQPAFQSGSLERYSALMDGCAVRLCDTLAGAAAAGEAVDMWRCLGTMTMGVVGSTAFGIDLHTMEDPASQHFEEGKRLMHASATVFSSSSIVNGSVYQVPLLMLPRAAKAVQWLAARLPDRRLVELTQARRVIRGVSQRLIDEWRAAHGGGGGAAGGLKAAAAAAGAATLEQLQGDAPAVLVGRVQGGGVGGGGGRDEAGGGGVGGGDDASADAPPRGGGARDQAPPAAEGKEANGATHAAAAAAAAGGGAGAEDSAGRGAKAKAGLGVAPGSFMGLMLRGRDKAGGARFDDDTIAAQANTFILAGYETTANTLSYAIYNVSLHRRVQERLLAEVDAFGRGRAISHADLAAFPYAEAVVKESLRLFPPAILTNRRVHKEEGMELVPGLVMRKGSSIFVCQYAYQRDEAYWPRPLDFLPERFLPEGSALAPTTEDAWTPFGAGARMCIGWRFALNEAKIALVRLYQRYTFDLCPGQDPLPLRQGITLSPANGVMCEPVARPADGAGAPAEVAAA